MRANFAALVIGSMAPDFAYYSQQFPLARFAHTIPGTFIVCLPSGLLALGLFYKLRRPLCFILPQPHRSALMAFASVRIPFRFWSFVTAAGSVLCGAWTHTIWDSFTHEGGWAVEHLSVLQAAFFHTQISVSYCLQQLSTVGAGAALAVTYFLWLRRQPPAASTDSNFYPEWCRYFLLGALLAVALVIAVPAARYAASFSEGYTAFRIFVFRTGVYATEAFIPLLLIASILLYAVHENRSKAMHR